MKSKNIDVSIIVPAYKQEKTIVDNLKALESILRSMHLNYEIIVVVDGFLDKTYKKAFESGIKWLSVIGYEQNRGKGHAVRFGMAKARGEIIGFVDSGDVDYTAIPMLIEHFKWYQADAIIASKRHPASQVIYPWQRRILSWGYQMLIRALFDINVRDTQVGMKFFKKQLVEKVLPRLLIKEFAFDIEMLAVAWHLGFRKIYEAPIRITLDFTKSSSVVSKGFLGVVWLMLRDTIAVFYRLKLRKYYQDSNKRNWLPNQYLEIRPIKNG